MLNKSGSRTGTGTGAGARTGTKTFQSRKQNRNHHGFTTLLKAEPFFCCPKYAKINSFLLLLPTDFENVENEWPIFYIFMIIDGCFKDNQDQVNEYQVCELCFCPLLSSMYSKFNRAMVSKNFGVQSM